MALTPLLVPKGHSWGTWFMPKLIVVTVSANAHEGSEEARLGYRGYVLLWPGTVWVSDTELSLSSPSSSARDSQDRSEGRVCSFHALSPQAQPMSSWCELTSGD